MPSFILAEKPSVAASFAAALGTPKDKAGFYRDSEYTIANCIGHLLSLYDAEDYDGKLKKWAVEDLPIMPEPFRHKPVESTQKQLALLQSLLKDSYDKYIIATDAGREGELIARLTFEYCGIADYSKVFRFWTSSALTKPVILDCLGKLKPAAAYNSLYSAGLYRQLADWLVGINFSRFFSISFSDRFIFGRVQTPVLAMVASREKEIASFAKTPFFRLAVKTSIAGSEFESHLLNADGGRDHPDRSALESLLASAVGNSSVTSVKTETKTENPQRLLDLTELQKLANVKHGYTAAKTLELAQALYEKHKVLSYPRTASRYLSRSNYDLFIECLQALGIEHEGIEASNTHIFNDEAMEKNKEDHHALLALAPIPESVSQEERDIFNLVAGTMSLVFRPPFIYEAISVTHSIGSLAFGASGRKVIQEGWKWHAKQGASGDNEDEDEEGETDDGDAQTIPELREGYTLAVSDPRITAHERKPPRPFTEASILTAMKKHSLGTPATRDSIIEGLVRNGYCLRKGRQFHPTEKAMFFSSSLPSAVSGYLSVETTSAWEEMLENDSEAFFSGVQKSVASSIAEMKSLSLEKFSVSFGDCPSCGGKIISGKFSYYCSNNGEKKCTFQIGKSILGAPITEADIKALLSGKRTVTKEMQAKNGNAFAAKLRLNTSVSPPKIAFDFDDVKKTKANAKK